jgi:hypothetical protein
MSKTTLSENAEPSLPFKKRNRVEITELAGNIISKMDHIETLGRRARSESRLKELRLEYQLHAETLDALRQLWRQAPSWWEGEDTGLPSDPSGEGSDQ